MTGCGRMRTSAVLLRPEPVKFQSPFTFDKKMLLKCARVIGVFAGRF